VIGMEKTLDRSGGGMQAVLLTILVMDATIAGILVGALGSPGAGLLVGLGMLAAPVVVVGPLVALLGTASGWLKLASAYPARPPAAEARLGSWASIALRWSWFGYNNCIRWAADATHLHLSIIRPLNALSPGMSIPWAELDFDESLPGRGAIACDTAAGPKLWLPRTMLETEAACRRDAAPVAASATP
jgi:hypothetical protein